MVGMLFVELYLDTRREYPVFKCPSDTKHIYISYINMQICTYLCMQ